METTIQIDIEQEAVAEEEAEPSPAADVPILEDGNGFGSGSDNMQFLTVVQDLQRAQGQETEAGVAALAGMSMGDPGMGQYLAEVMRTLSVGRQEAVDLMREGQVKQGGVKDQLHKEKAKLALARGRKKMVQVAIWRCAVCGRADLPYIACFVAPFIVGYQEQEI